MSSLVQSLTQYLPPTPTLLSKWMLFISLVSVFNTVQCYTTTSLNKRIYPLAASRGEVSGLGSRTFGSWTLIVAIVRWCACSRLDEAVWFDLAHATFLVALGHFGLEVLVYRSTRVGSAALSTIIIASSTSVWMTAVRGEFVG